VHSDFEGHLLRTASATQSGKIAENPVSI
jgi:hypothetical protein